MKFRSEREEKYRAFRDWARPEDEKVFNFLEKWAEVMETFVEQMGIPVEDCAWYAGLHLLRKYKLSRYEFKIAMDLLCRYWVYGLDLKAWRGKPPKDEKPAFLVSKYIEDIMKGVLW